MLNVLGSDVPCELFLSHLEVANLLGSLLKLRQACCHPQVGSSGLRSLQQTPMTMEDILGVVNLYERIIFSLLDLLILIL